MEKLDKLERQSPLTGLPNMDGALRRVGEPSRGKPLQIASDAMWGLGERNRRDTRGRPISMRRPDVAGGISAEATTTYEPIAIGLDS